MGFCNIYNGIDCNWDEITVFEPERVLAWLAELPSCLLPPDAPPDFPCCPAHPKPEPSTLESSLLPPVSSNNVTSCCLKFCQGFIKSQIFSDTITQLVVYRYLVFGLPFRDDNPLTIFHQDVIKEEYYRIIERWKTLLVIQSEELSKYQSQPRETVIQQRLECLYVAIQRTNESAEYAVSYCNELGLHADFQVTLDVLDPLAEAAVIVQHTHYMQQSPDIQWALYDRLSQALDDLLPIPCSD